MTFAITNTASGIFLGEYAGANAAEALDNMARDAGYADHAEACTVASGDDLIAVEVR